MNHTTHPSNTRKLGAPADWDHAAVPCDALAITDQSVDGEPVMVSFWRPTTEELAQLVDGAAVTLWIYGASHPVVALGVEP